MLLSYSARDMRSIERGEILPLSTRSLSGDYPFMGEKSKKSY